MYFQGGAGALNEVKSHAPQIRLMEEQKLHS